MELETKAPEYFVRDTPATFVVSKSTKRLWAIQLDLLAKIDAICRKHGIRYSIDSGTLIGAKRHGGYIPWDDDIDVIMPRKDFEAFQAVVSNEISGYYFFQTAANSPGYYRPFARLLNINTVAALRSDMREGRLLWNYRQCVFVDILVVDNIPDDELVRRQHFARLHTLHSQYWVARECVKYAKNWRLMEKTAGAIYKILVGAIILFISKCGWDILARRFDRFCRELCRYSNDCTTYGAPYTNRPYEIIKFSEFDSCEDVGFEYLTVRAFKNYDRILSVQYGDWHRHVIGNRQEMYYELRGVEVC